MNMISFLNSFMNNEDSKFMLILTIIAVAMIIDFITGTISAWVNPDIEFKSKAGINGILRKIASMLALIIFIPVSVVIPFDMGTNLVYTLYVGYLLFEVKSIIENIGKNGTDTTLFDDILKKFNNKNDKNNKIE